MRLKAILLTSCLTAGLWAQDKEAERLKDCGTVLTEVMGAPDDSIPNELLERAECVAVIPALKKAALGFGGRYGVGAVSCRGGETGGGPWGPPSMLRVTGGSFGLQLGGQSSDVVFLVMNRNGIKHLVKDKFTVGADASAAAGPKGRSAAAATNITMRAEILTYARTRGLFAGVSLDGATVRPDNDGNKRLYGRTIDAKKLLLEGGAGVPAAAQPFLNALNKYAPRNVSAK
jgi:lipid-binding SYLF domain-containing protein